MKTIYAGLPFYDYLVKQEKSRSHSKIPFYCGPDALPPFQFCHDIIDVPALYNFYLMACDGSVVLDITSYFTASIVELSTVYYMLYDGSALSTSLPYGTYYLQFEDDSGQILYSEHFAVVDIDSGNWIKIQCSNTKDLGDILYATGDFEEVYYLNTQLNYPANEIVEIGEEKDGEFITEKLVTKYMYRISDYISRALHRCLIRLTQHDSITITDEVGNTYTPDVGNVQITSEWPHFDVCHVVIQFNDGENTAFVWTYDKANMD